MVLLHLQQQSKSLSNTFLLATYTVKRERGEKEEREGEREREEREGERGRGVKGECVRERGKYKLTCTCSVVIKSVNQFY